MQHILSNWEVYYVTKCKPKVNQIVSRYSSNYITKKQQKSDDHLSKFDWHDLSPIF